jgi:DNA-binding HxlR family transcriptional regulator
MGETQAQHDHRVLDPACASRRLFEAISGKWSPLVVMALKDGGKKRHGELRRELGAPASLYTTPSLWQRGTCT